MSQPKTQGGGSGGYITYQHATLTHGTSTFSFPIPDVLVAKTDYRTIIVGNAHSFVPAGYATFDAYLNACKSMTYDEAKQEIYAEMTARSMSILPMWGKFIDGTGEEIPFRFESKTNTTITGTIHLSRSVCRMDLKNHVANSLNIAWVKVCNYRNKGYYFHNEAPNGEIVPGLASTPPTGSGDGYVRVAEPSNGIQELKAGLYAFSNIVPIVVQNDNQTTYLMIAGYYQDGETPNTSKLTYYRFNMAKLGRSQVLKRNYIYRASIMSVKGPGADSEQGAKDESSPLLEYEVDNNWDDDDENTGSDEHGNYMILSRSQITFADGMKDATEVVKVKVKEGTTWSVSADHGVSDNPAAFSFAKVDDTSFSITTLLDNATDFSYSGRLKVTASTPQGTKIVLYVSLMQLSTASEMKILLVDGRNGTLNYKFGGSGGTLSLLVQTGSSYAGWTAEDDGNSLTAWSGASFTQSGADKGYLTITAPANVSSAARTASIIVHREGVPDVVVNLTQPKSDKLLSIFPMPENGTLTVEGFDPAVGTPHGMSFQKEFWVTLADPGQYTISVTSSFDNARDLKLSWDNPLAKTIQAAHPVTIATDTLKNGINGAKFWINVFRTGPGDPTIKGTITVKAVPKTAGLTQQEMAFNVNIATSCVIGDVVLGSNLLVADRNVGATPRLSETGSYVPALNFSTVPNLHITSNSNADNLNTQFKGNFYTLQASAILCQAEYADKNVDDAETTSPYYKSADRLKWLIPSRDQALTILNNSCYSKSRSFIVSKKRSSSGKYIACFFPLTSASKGYYWTSSTHMQTIYYYLLLPAAPSPTLPYSQQTTLMNVRCVRTVL